MSTIGRDENIQTLFRELRLEDERAAPRFHVVWNGAQSRTRPRIKFKLSFAVFAVSVVVCLFSLGLWLMGQATNNQESAVIVNRPENTTSSPAPLVMSRTPDQVVPLRANHRVNSMRRAKRLAERQRLRLLAIREAEMLRAAVVSNWRSPTAMLMQSPADDVLMSLPQLYRPVFELNSFLPNVQ